jgi:ABC-type transporter Mla subunit MlaD
MNDFVKKIADPAAPDTLDQLTKFTQDQVDTLHEAAKAVAGMAGAIPLMSATGLQGPGGDLTIATSESIENLKKVIPIISKLSGGKEAEIKNLNSMLEATKAFNEAVNGKLPSIAQSIAQGEAQKSVDFLQGALDLINGKVEAAPAAPAAEPAAAAPAAAAPAAPAAPAAGGMGGMAGMSM